MKLPCVACGLAAGLVSLFNAQQAVAQNTLLALFSFENGAAVDISGNNVVATPISSPVFVPAGYEGGGVMFNGTSAIRVSLNINPSVSPQVTFGTWVRPTAGNAIRHLISHDDSGFDRNLGIDNRGGGLGWSCFTGSGVNGFVPVTLNEWQFVAAVYDSAANSTLLYVDGQTRTEAGSPGTGNIFVEIGRSPCCSLGVAGTVDNAFFLSEALSVARLDEIRAGGLHKIPPCPLVLASPRAQAICPMGTAEFTVDAAGAGTLVYEWRKDGVLLADGPTGTGSIIAGATTATLMVQNIGGPDGGNYAATITNTCGPATSQSALLTICPPDFNCDGIPNSQDFFDFLALFFASDKRADFNGDGVLNSQDFFDFLVVFFSGCD